MQKFILFIFISLVALGCSRREPVKSFSILPKDNFPRWLKSENYRTDQTSGIAFLGSNVEGEKVFLLVDDIGKIHHFVISEDTVFKFSPVVFSTEVDEFLAEFPKMDFEEIVYDEPMNEVYLSIEGNGGEYTNYLGIYRLFFKNDDVFNDTVVNIDRLDIKPIDQFTNFSAPNIGYEGLAVDENSIYLGLEGIYSDSRFTDSTLIFIVDKSSLNIIKQISTRTLNIKSICALYSDYNFSLWGIDRNHRKIFHLEFDEEYNITDSHIEDYFTLIPGYQDIKYVGSIESITMDDEKNIYMIDDPWHDFFVPGEDVLSRLDNETVENFKEFVPVIFKYSFH